MDTSVAGITFDDKGVCSRCSEFVAHLESVKESVADHLSHRETLLAQVRAAGGGSITTASSVSRAASTVPMRFTWRYETA